VAVRVLENVTKTEAKQGFRPDLEGLRAVAVLLVVAYHAWPKGFSAGFIGVDLFFVLSGFFITGLLNREFEQKGTFSLREFYSRRLRRILPVALLVAFATMVCALLFLPSIRWHNLALDFLAVTYSMGNIVFANQATQYFAPVSAPSPFLHMWSLGVEEQFYLVWPIVLLLLLTATKRVSKSSNSRLVWLPRVVLSLLISASLAFSIWITPTNQPLTYFSLFSRAFELGAGALVALCVNGSTSTLLKRENSRNVLGLAALVTLAISLVLIGRGVGYPGPWMTLPVSSTVLFILSGGSLISRILATRPFRAVGRWSFALYLWHWPILIIAAQNKFCPHPLSAKQSVSLILIAVALAALTYKFFEDPIRRSNWLAVSYRRTTIFSVATLGVCSMLVPLTLALVPSERPVSTKYPDKVDAIKSMVEDAIHRKYPVPSSLNPSLTSTQTYHPDRFTQDCLLDQVHESFRSCVFGDLRAKTTVWLIGDSHAQHWFSAVNYLAKKYHFKLVAHSHASCTPVLAASAAEIRAIGRTESCIIWLKKLNQAYARAEPDVTIASSTEVRSTTQLGYYLNEIRFFQSRARRVLVIGDNAHSLVPRPICLADHTGDARACAVMREQTIEDVPFGRYHRLLKRALLLRHVPYADASDWLCAKNGLCPAVVGNVLVYVDQTHISNNAARFFAPYLALALMPQITSGR
jgi:peptidoglycan/LPS O-acetylase OafA/YrhL